MCCQTPTKAYTCPTDPSGEGPVVPPNLADGLSVYEVSHVLEILTVGPNGVATTKYSQLACGYPYVADVL